jgi:hypothetical protein
MISKQEFSNIRVSISKSLQNAVDRMHSHRSTDEWTNVFKTAIAGAAFGNNYQAAAITVNHKYDNKWFYDVAWYKNNGSGNLEEVIMVAESETETLPDAWEKAIKYDMEKLLISNATVKVLIALAFDEKRVTEIIERCEKSVKAFKMMNPGDAVLIFVFDAQNDMLNEYLIEKGTSLNVVQEILYG